MKKTLRLAAIAVCVSAICGPAMAAGNDATSTSKTSTHAASVQKAQQELPASDSKVAQDLSRASKVIGTDVDDAKGKKIGDIKDVVLDRSSGRVAYAVISFGGVMGVGDKYFAVPWKALKAGSDEHYVLNTTQETLKKAQGFDKDHWPDMANEKWNRDNYRLYNQNWDQANSSWKNKHESAARSSGTSDAAGTSMSAEGAARNASSNAK